MILRHARCNCGQVGLGCAGEPVRISMCHCCECQKRTGSPFSVQAWYALPDVEIAPGETRTFVRTGESGKLLTFRFCPSCGSTVFWDAQARPGLIAVAVGCFADPGFPPPLVSVWELSRHPWVEVPPGAERYRGP